MALTIEQIADRYFDVLVAICGANPNLRADFVRCLVEPRANYEFRFQGRLGFGGKFYLDRHSDPHVDCYKEDRTPERVQIILTANRHFRALERELSEVES